MEQLPEQPHQRLRSAAAERVVRRRDTRLRWTFGEGAQNGPVRVQSVLSNALLRQSVSASDRDYARHQVARIESGRGVHV